MDFMRVMIECVSPNIVPSRNCRPVIGAGRGVFRVIFLLQVGFSGCES